MRKHHAIALLLCGVTALGGCVEIKSNVPPIVVNVKNEGDQCQVTVIRFPFTQPLDFQRVSQAQLLEVARQAKTRRAVLVSDVKAQYKCMGAALVTLQEAGLQVDLAVWDSR